MCSSDLGKVIDGDGTFLFNVPMNLDYIYTNEFGEQVLSDDPSKGIPTKGRYRFKFKWQNQQGLQNNFMRADFLVPNIKEYGWTSNTDPFSYNATALNYPQIPIGSTTGSTYISTSNVGLSNPTTINVESYTIYINGLPYTGTLNSIPLNLGDTLVIVATPVDPTQAQDISFVSYPLPLFELLKSYAFSTDWDDYANTQEAINCEDTFYEFKYNKVYTTTGGLNFNYNNDLSYPTTRIQLYTDYELMDSDSIIASTLDILADETCLRNDMGEVLQIRSSDETIDRKSTRLNSSH